MTKINPTQNKKSWKSYFNLRKINIVIRILTVSDVIIISSFGLISPIFAIFVTNTVKGGSVAVAGLAAGIYLITRSIFQIPLGILIDKIKGEKDDFWAMLIGSILFSIIPLFYLIISTPLHLYVVQFFYGIATAMVIPSWYAIFTRHIDKNYEGVEWGAYQTFVDLGAAGTAFLGGFLAQKFGFPPLFILVSFVSLIGSLFLLGVRKNMKTGRVLV
ncbi:MFS transporter [Patescibacteria group bacterium]